MTDQTVESGTDDSDNTEEPPQLEGGQDAGDDPKPDRDTPVEGDDDDGGQ